jgi:alpha-L-fucosidase 2
VNLSWNNGSLEECRLAADRDGKWNIRLGESSLAVEIKAGRSKTLRLSDGKLVAA